MKLQYFPLLLLLNFLSLDKYPLCNLTKLYLHVIWVKPICISSLFDSTLSYLAHPTDCNVRSPQSSFSLTPKYSAGYLFTIAVRGSACFLVKLLSLSATPSSPPPLEGSSGFQESRKPFDHSCMLYSVAVFILGSVPSC